MSSHLETHKTLRWIAFLAAIVGVAVLVMRFTERGIHNTTSGIERSLDKVLGALTHSDTRIVEGRAEITGNREINELSLLELHMSATRRFENESYILKYLPAGTKQLVARGDYRITAGYRLEPGISLRFENNTPVARFPKPVILGVELVDIQFLSEREGWANSITPEDRATLLRELRQQMRSEAEKAAILEKADATLRTRLAELVGVPDVRIERIPEAAP